MRVCTIHPDDAGEDGRSRGGYEKWACRRLRPSAVSRTGSCLPVRVASRSMPSCTLIRDRDGMIRTRIQLTEEQARALEAQARMEERSMAERVRECVAEYLARRRTPDVRELARRARGLKGRFRSGSPGLAEAHDRYLDDAFEL